MSRSEKEDQMIEKGDRVRSRATGDEGWAFDVHSSYLWVYVSGIRGMEHWELADTEFVRKPEGWVAESPVSDICDTMFTAMTDAHDALAAPTEVSIAEARALLYAGMSAYALVIRKENSYGREGV